MMISLEKISKKFNNLPVLDNISLHIQRGEHIVLVGANGAGKTTLFRCLLGEYDYEGQILIDGLSPSLHRQAVLTRVGFVPQYPPPLKMPVGQLLQFAAGVCASEPKRIVDLALKLGLEIPPLLSRPFVKLSGGQKQKLLISIALGRATDILVMDEPAANLDPEARQIFFQLLEERQLQAVTLISSHRLDELAVLVNRVLELDLGKVILDNSAVEYRNHRYGRAK